MKILKINLNNQEEAIIETKKVLTKGGLIIYPTETCFGLGGDATNSSAVDKIFQFKGDRHKPVAIAVANKEMAQNYVQINETANNLYQNFLPGPLTIISQSKNKAVKRLESKQGTLGIRIPDYPFVTDLIKSFGKPITTTSANASGQKPPFSLKDFLQYNSQTRIAMVDLFLDPGPLPLRTPSTVVDTTLNEPTIIRQGEIDFKNITGQAFESDNEEQTHQIAATIYNQIKNPSLPIIFALQGDLGAGKTQFTKGIAKMLGIKNLVASPTFNIIKEYPFGPNNSNILHHIDTWRLENGQEIIELGLLKMINKKDLIIIEWPQKVKDVLKKLTKIAVIVWVDIETLSETRRKIKYIKF